jgi:two-component sensor histidine kinase
LDQTQKVLLAELQHRTRNLLAMIQSIAKRSARTSRSVPEFVAELQKRLQALSRAESLAPTSSSGSVDIRALIDTELSAHLPAPHNAEKIHVDGPPVAVPHATAQPLSLALHELATNAVKHGALGQEAGKLSIVWRVESDEEENKLALEWRESSVRMPELAQVKREGYGTELITRALPYQLGAETELEFAPDGVRCRVQVPIFENDRSHR